MSDRDKRQLIEELTPEEKERIVKLLVRFIISKRKDRERMDKISKI